MAVAQYEELMNTLYHLYDDSFPRLLRLPELQNQTSEALCIEMLQSESSAWLPLLRLPPNFRYNRPLWVPKCAILRAVSVLGTVVLGKDVQRIILTRSVFLNRDIEMTSPSDERSSRSIVNE